MMWRPIQSCPENVAVRTKIDDEKGVRNEQVLVKRKNLFWLPEGDMYVYYAPTHWAIHAPADGI